MASDASHRSASEGAEALKAGAFCVLDTFAVSRVAGDDARVFLNGQFSSDIKALAAGRWQLSSYSTPKGRALATFVVAAQADGFVLVTRRSIAEPTVRRLGMFVLRSKVVFDHASLALIGLAGPAASATVAAICGGEPPAEGECRALGDESLLGMGGDAFWLLLPAERLDARVTQFAASLPQVSSAAWDALEVAAGRGWVEEATRESFVPQMLNLDLNGGVSFKKGCYPGQEIVARTQYLGKVKRRMLRFGLVGEPPAPGTGVFTEGKDGQAVGEVVLGGPVGPGRSELLAVLQLELAADSGLRLGGGEGPVLEPLALPYSVE